MATPIPDHSEHTDLHVTCAPGMAELVADELRALGFSAELRGATGVGSRGTLMDGMWLCLWLRTALHVLREIAVFRCATPDELYRGIRDLEWETVIPLEGYLSVVSRIAHPSIDNSMYANQLVKDAIVDRFRTVHGHRPDSGPRNDRIVIEVFWKDDLARVSLNLAGNKLSDRGYRRIPHAAPLRETLAAALVLASGYDGTVPFVNPMCGSGTLAIEAALLAAHRAPGLLRGNFGGMHLADFDRDEWEGLRADARRSATRDVPPIVASDLDPAAVDAAQRNAQTAGVEHLVRFATGDFADTPLPDAPGVVLVNPEYGLRLGEEESLVPLHRRYGDWLKQRCTGWRAGIFTGSPRLAKEIGLRTARRLPFWNADIECRLLMFELY